jgi:antitoxin MazE
LTISHRSDKVDGVDTKYLLHLLYLTEIEEIMSTKHLAQWGNSLAMRISKDEAEELGWERDTPIKVSIVEGKLIAEAVVAAPKYTLEELLEGLTPETAHADFDEGIDNPVGEEPW